MTSISDEPLDPGRALEAVRAPGIGGIALFVGTVRDTHLGRDVVRLSYSAYAEMAEREIAAIVAAVERELEVTAAVMHRVGELDVGDVAIVVAAAHRHREPAFLACRRIVDEVKRRVPIWKHERYADGTAHWVDPTAATAPPARVAE